MSGPSKKGPRLDVSGEKPALAHNPFAKLAGLAVPEGAEPVPTTAGEPRVEPEKKTKLGRVILRRETKNRGGKPVVVVTGFGSSSPLDAEAVEALATELKRALAVGGTVEARGDEHVIVIQGDQPARVAELLRKRGFVVGGVTS